MIKHLHLHIIFSVSLLAVVLSMYACKDSALPSQSDDAAAILDHEEQKAAILQTINDETAAAFARDYDRWRTHWIHDDYVNKSYMNFADSTLSETLGWPEIDQYVKNYIDAHPEPAPLPKRVEEADIRIYGSGAWVVYHQDVPDVGLKRESRLMEYDGSRWRIAGMQTVIYGPSKAH